MSFTGVNINKIDGGLGGGETTDRVAVLVIGAGAIGDALAVNTAYHLLQLGDAEALGITAERDVSENCLDHYHLSEVFRLSPETDLYLISVPSATKVSDLKNLADFVTALRSIEGVNTIGIAGLTADVTTGEGEIAVSGLANAVTGAQILVDNLRADHIYIDAVLLEGIGGYLNAAIANNVNLRTLASPNVSVIISHDHAIAAQNEVYTNHAAVGSAIGMLLVRAVHENLGSVDIETKPRIRKGEQDYTLTDIKAGLWLSASLSNGRAFNTLSVPDQNQLDALGYIYIGQFEDYGGYFFSNSHTCEESGSDYCFIERNAIWNKCARIIRRTLIPRIRSKVKADPATGYIKNTTITDWDGRIRKALEPMVADGNASDFDIYINPKQAAVPPIVNGKPKPFSVSVKLVADGVVHEFDIDLGFSNKI